MVLVSSTKKWLMEGGLWEGYAGILAYKRKVFTEAHGNKPLLEMNYQEIRDYVVSYPWITSTKHGGKAELKRLEAIYGDLLDGLRRVKQYHIQSLEEEIESKGNLYESPFTKALFKSRLNERLKKIYEWKLETLEWDFINWKKGPFEVK